MKLNKNCSFKYVFILIIVCFNLKNRLYSYDLKSKIVYEPLYTQQWYLYKDNNFYKRNNININAHIHIGNNFLKYSGKGVKIAILDDGFDLYHQDLSGAIINKKDFKNNKDKSTYHGTAVSGIIAARQNQKGIKGIASDSKILLLKYKEDLNDEELIKLFEKAKKFGADIINCSWGTYNLSKKVKDKIVDLAINGRNKKGIIIVFAAGNDNKNIQSDEANIKEVISVGSTNEHNLRAKYSNFGKNLDILAPGGEKLGITTLDLSGDRGIGGMQNDYILYNDFKPFIGTSASASIVSGIIALMLEKNPKLTRIEIENILKESADKIGNILYKDGRNDYYGYGKINVEKAMNQIGL